MRKKRRNKRRKRIFVLTAEVLILTFLLGTAYVMAKYDKIQRVEIDSENVTVNEGAVKEGYTTIALLEEIPEKDSWKREHMRTASL